MSALDPRWASGVIADASSGPGGISMALDVFSGIPGVVHEPAKRGIFRRQPKAVLIGDWRYEVAGDGRLYAEHVVNEIVIAHGAVDARAVGDHVARALTQHATRHGPTAEVAIIASLEALAAGS